MTRLSLLACLLILSTAVVVSAEDAATELKEDERGGWLLLPILAYSPDTSVMLGASGLRFFSLDPEAESSVFSPVGIVTAKKQVLVFLGTRLEWDRSRFEMTPSYIRFPDKFYGVGRNVVDDDEEDYTPESLGFALSWSRELTSGLRAGGVYELKTHRLVETEAGGALESGDYLGTDSTLLSWPGLRVEYDTRDNQWSPSGGWWLASELWFAREVFGSDVEFTSRRLDLRGYLPMGERSVLAFQVMGASLDGTPPFFALPMLGGQEGLRGYLQGRFRHRTMALGRAEWRSGERWGRFGWVAFAGIGDVSDRPGDLSLEEELWTFGAGVRYTLDEAERVKLRLDFGMGNGDGGFFISFGEAF